MRSHLLTLSVFSLSSAIGCAHTPKAPTEPTTPSSENPRA